MARGYGPGHRRQVRTLGTHDLFVATPLNPKRSCLAGPSFPLPPSRRRRPTRKRWKFSSFWYRPSARCGLLSARNWPGRIKWPRPQHVQRVASVVLGAFSASPRRGAAMPTGRPRIGSACAGVSRYGRSKRANARLNSRPDKNAARWLDRARFPFRAGRDAVSTRHLSSPARNNIRGARHRLMLPRAKHASDRIRQAVEYSARSFFAVRNVLIVSTT